ncbi:MAG TPA: response regulator [Candidatus Brocadiia bacterium]|nr:response regulator [Planctomycetota bacterium]MBI4008291.1 response regulator [Planctomycetota bacterium]MDO8094182.1 response regulator [Candidatus Brocadiales bacterium]
MKTVLVVEDDKNQGLLYEQELSLEGYNVMLAKNGKEAIARVEECVPDIIVMDITMPTMDGIEAMGKILAKHSKIPIIINTAYSSYKDNFMTWSADAYIVKSSDLTELKNKIKEMLNINA